MPAGLIERMYAFQVYPREVEEIKGGQVTNVASIQEILDVAFDQSNLTQGPGIGFNFTSVSRNHAVRDFLLSIAFGLPDEALKAAEDLSLRLASAMDNRSNPALFAVSTHQVKSNPSSRSVVLWTFPQQAVFRFSAGSDSTVIDLMDAFNRESNVRKAALFTGENGKVDFLGGKVLDLQGTTSTKPAADFWVVKFLDAQLQLGAKEGSRLLATALRNTHDKCREDPGAQAQVHSAILGIISSNQSLYSLQDVEDRYLSGSTAEVFHNQVKSEPTRTSSFQLDESVFESQIHYRIYTLQTGVIVSVPLEVAGTVEVTDEEDRRTLKLSGMVMEEKLRSRRG
ncbi:hypothetical protein DV517_21240 [Streptomyces sp. S816]|uniref:hypothetical protein n=1 Tax=Streptomyces sp. S816 TaxID=2283197 RepID=UPI00109C53FA|nr:hypothetical protein [Streptomyces sp. S816]TGZ17151.1 hypothetical protein DV517_21240 [Streptomyces sp. S816]